MRGSTRRRYRRKLEGCFVNVLPSSPDPSTYSGFPEDMDRWSCSQLEQYYWNNVDRFGKEQARFIYNNDMSSVGGWCSKAEDCRYDCDWNRRMRAEGLKTGSNLISNSLCISTTVSEGAASFLSPGLIRGALWTIGIAGGLYVADKTGLLDKIKGKK